MIHRDGPVVVPWLFVTSVALADAGTVEPVDEHGQVVDDVPPPIACYLIGTAYEPNGNERAGVHLGIAAPPEIAGQIIDALRASAEGRGASLALVAATDQAQAHRKDPR